MNVLDAALDYASRGLPVFPVYGVTPYRADRFICLCGKGLTCDRPGKHPMSRYASNGFKDASTDPKKIRWWWECAPDANVAIAPHPNCVVLDVDPKHGGDATLDRFETQHGNLPATWTVKTGGNGWHHYFGVETAVQNTVSQVGLGLDFKGAGNGYVVAPPSRHVSGNRYEWVAGRALSDIPIAPMPGWLLAATRSGGAGKAVATPSATWRELVRNGVGEGARNQNIAKLAGHFLRRYVDPVVTLEIMTTWNLVRCKPPLSEAEVQHIVNNIAGREMKRRGANHG
jgi:Bifunctional DNA primase/polymerase, N-terminal/Primase C terminal 1 (PriCT-1)